MKNRCSVDCSWGSAERSQSASSSRAVALPRNLIVVPSVGFATTMGRRYTIHPSPRCMPKRRAGEISSSAAQHRSPAGKRKRRMWMVFVCVLPGCLQVFLGQSQWEFYGGFYDIKYHHFCWHCKEREGWSFMGCEESFITMKPIWHSYLVLSLDNCVHETPTETGLICMHPRGRDQGLRWNSGPHVGF